MEGQQMELQDVLDALNAKTTPPQAKANVVTAIIIGGGGYGTAAVDPTDDSRLIKYFKQSVTCKEAAYEYGAHQSISTVFREFMVDHRSCKIRIPMPLAFDEVGGTLKGCHNFSCSYTMEWIRSARPDHMQQHTLLDEDHQGFGGMIMFASHDVESRKVDGCVQVTEAEMTAGRPRGEYLGIQQMLDKFHSLAIVEDIAYRMGILYGVVMAAGYAPKDVEVVVDDEGYLAMYDFGMVFVGEIEEFDADVDMYTPKEPAVVVAVEGEEPGDAAATAAIGLALYTRYKDGLEFARVYFAKKKGKA